MAEQGRRNTAFEAAEHILKVTGPRRILLLGADVAALAAALRFRGACVAVPGPPASTNAAVAGAVIDADMVVVGIDRANDLTDPKGCLAQAAQFLAKRPSGKRAADGVVVVWNRWMAGQDAPPLREDCDRLFLGSRGACRRHPAALTPDVYEAYGRPELFDLSFYEVLPADAAGDGPVRRPPGDGGPRPDMLRESGPRADAHIVRYALAAQWVRSGDTVLDCACGSGDGTAVLAALSASARVIGIDADPDAIGYAQAHYGHRPGIEYRIDTPETLGSVPTGSIGLAVSFDTLERIADPERFLAEIARVLRPDGRFIAGVPHLWTDGHGTALPGHLHVFNRKQFHALLARRLLLEAEFRQTAPGGVKLTTAQSRLLRVDPAEEIMQETEWLIMVASADPLAPSGQPYRHSAFHSPASAAGPLPRLVDFAASYDNPWIYRPVVQLGERLDNPGLLDATLDRLLTTTRPDSADHGAALCVKGYQVLERGPIEEADTLIDRIAAYRRGTADDPHVQRWRLSLAFLAARLSMLQGRPDEALVWFERTVADDPLTFSPLLASKTVAAWFWIGILRLTQDAPELAAGAFRAGGAAAAAALGSNLGDAVGTLDHPLPFGFPELAEVADAGGQCALALIHLPLWHRSPGLFWQKVDAKRFGLVTWARQLKREADRLLLENQRFRTNEKSRLEQVETTLQLIRLLSADRIDRVIVYGAGAIGGELVAALADMPCRCVCVVDRNRELYDKTLYGVPIVSLADSLAFGCDTLAVASVAFKDEIVHGITEVYRAAGRTPRILVATPDGALTKTADARHARYRDVTFAGDALHLAIPWRLHGLNQPEHQAGWLTIFQHVPKSGGTTVEFIMLACAARRGETYQRFGVDARFEPPVWMVQGWTGGWPTLESFTARPDRPVPDSCSGHFPFGAHALLDRPAAYVTLVRDPISREVSSYNFHYQRGFIDGAKSLEQLIDDRAILDNPQVRMLAGPDAMSGACGADVFRRALDNIERHFALVGVSERSNEFIAAFLGMFGYPPVLYVNSQVTVIRKIESASPELRALLTDFHQWDIRLHTHCRERWEMWKQEHVAEIPAAPLPDDQEVVFIPADFKREAPLHLVKAGDLIADPAGLRLRG